MQKNSAEDVPKPGSLHIDSQPTWRGGQQQVLHLLEGMVRRGYRAELAARPNTPLFDRAKDAGIIVHAVPMRGEWDVPSAVALARITRRNDLQILHAHSSHAHGLAWLARLFNRRVRLVVTRRVDFRIRRNLGNRFKYLRGVDRFIAISGAVREVLLKAGIPEAKIGFATSGIDPARFKEIEPADLRAEYDLPHDSLLLGVVGHLVDEHKGQKDFLRAAAEVAPEFPHARFLIIGEGDDHPEFEQLAGELGISDKILFTGFRSDVPAVLRSLDVLVMPSRYEALGTAAVEGMMAGLPLIASRVGGLQEAVVDGETGLLFETGNVQGLAHACRALLSDPELRRKMGTRGRERALQLYSVEKMVEGTIDVYNDLFGRR